MKFSELDLDPTLMAALKAMRFDELTPIQEATYPLISKNKDICALAETGSGKTAACAIPLVQKVDPSLNEIQALVLVPTRELCLQYISEIREVAAGSGITCVAIYGGVEKNVQIAKLRHEAHILVATPGRLIDLIYDGHIEFPHVRCAILDEADELLKVGFLEDIEFIMSCIICEHQTMLFSATMPDDIKKLAHDCLKDPEHITLIADRAAPESLEHHFQYLSPRRKLEELTKYLRQDTVKQAIIFCNARNGVDDLCKNLRREIKGVEYIHAGLSQDKRSTIFRKFKEGRITYLIATDVAGRGLDFSHVTHVINWNLPRGNEQYTHRTGRAGRMGRKGIAYSYITKRDLTAVRSLIRHKNISPIWIGENPLKGDAGNSPKPKSAKKKRNRRRRPRSGGGGKKKENKS